MNKFNILYWNINNKAGSSNEKAKNIVLNTINDKEIFSEINNRVKGLDLQSFKDFDAIVFTESNWNFIECFNNVYNNENEYFDTFSIPKISINDNDIFIATKKKHKFCQIEKLCKIMPNCNYLHSIILNIDLIGLRICNGKGSPKLPSQLHELKINDNKFIMIGDFNETSVMYYIKTNGYEKVLNDYFNKRGVIKECDDGTNTCSYYGKHSRPEYIDNRPDKIYTTFDNSSINFIKVLTPEKIYIKAKYLNSDGHIKPELMVKKNTVDRHFEFINKNVQYNNDSNLYSEIKVNYASTGLVGQPYPDHNLLFASIDLGD